jgi:hypothetical protein
MATLFYTGVPFGEVVWETKFDCSWSSNTLDLDVQEISVTTLVGGCGKGKDGAFSRQFYVS